MSNYTVLLVQRKATKLCADRSRPDLRWWFLCRWEIWIRKAKLDWFFYHSNPHVCLKNSNNCNVPNSPKCWMLMLLCYSPWAFPPRSCGSTWTSARSHDWKWHSQKWCPSWCKNRSSWRGPSDARLLDTDRIWHHGVPWLACSHGPKKGGLTKKML